MTNPSNDKATTNNRGQDTDLRQILMARRTRTRGHPAGIGENQHE